jgi:PST family polysaccharide transporter
MSFARILRSSALMGGAQVVVLAAAFVRTKIIAIVLGASGVGLIGLFNAFSGNISSFAGWGLGTSGVRLIAGANENDKPARIAAVRRMGWLLSLLGLALGLLTFWPTARFTFDSSEYATEMAIVALAVPCLIASSAWSAILQASGKIGSLAKVQMAGALTGLLLGLPAIYFWGTIGIAISILLAAAVPASVLWRVVRSAQPPALAAAADSADLRHLIELGGALMVVGWLGQLSAYAVRLAIVNQSGLEAAGYYQAAYAISGSLPGFVFAAMGADFFPRVAAAKDEAEARDITEKQIQAALLLGLPMVVGLVALGRWALRLLYADSFDAALPLLPWMAWGVLIRLMTWPMGFWLMARGSGRMVIAIETVGALIASALPFLLLERFGLVAAGAAFALSCMAYGLILIVVFRLRSGGWFGVRTHVWAITVVAALAMTQLAASYQDGLISGLLLAAAVTSASAWVYRREMKDA